MMTATKPPVLTRLEQQILEHRLEVPDAIADATELSEWLVSAVCDRLLAGRWEDAMYWYPLATEMVLTDAIEGSTWIACLTTDGASRQKLDSHCHAGDRLAEKVGSWLGCELEFPWG